MTTADALTLHSPRMAAWRRPLRSFFGNRSAVLGAILLFLIVLIAVAAPLIAPYPPNAQDLKNRLAGPTRQHWLGTDNFGRDTLSRLLIAGRVSLTASVIATSLAAAIGVPFGLAAAFLGGAMDATMSRIADALMSLPGVIFAIAIVGVLGPGLTNSMIAIGIIAAPDLFRVARGAGRTVVSENYMMASRVIGCSTTRMLRRHLLPNAISPILIQVSFVFAAAILAEASLSFLGLGVQPPTPSWGTMLRDGFQTINQSAFPILPPSAAILLTVVSLSLVGDGVRDALSGRSRTT